jgi:hypothetical protein
MSSSKKNEMLAISEEAVLSDEEAGGANAEHDDLGLGTVGYIR